MKWSFGLLLAVLMGIQISLGGCCCGGDTETKIIEKQPVSEAPLGEQLIKLQEAHDKGAMSDEEYQKARENLMKGQ
jgi:hypothetical protein